MARALLLWAGLLAAPLVAGAGLGVVEKGHAHYPRATTNLTFVPTATGTAERNCSWSHYEWRLSSLSAYTPSSVNVTNTYTYHNLTASTSVDCENNTRVIGDLTTTATGTNTSVSLSYITTNYSIPEPTCTPPVQDCLDLYDNDYERFRRCPQPTTSSAELCGPCGIVGGTIDLLYFPPPRATPAPDLCANTTRSPTLCPLGPTTATNNASNPYNNSPCYYATATTTTENSGPYIVSDGHTFYENRAYISVAAAYATDYCGFVGQNHTGSIVEVASTEVFSIGGYHHYFADNGYPFDFQDLYDPPSDAYYLNCNGGGGVRCDVQVDDRFTPGKDFINGARTMEFGGGGGSFSYVSDNWIWNSAYAPLILMPTQIRSLDPAWATCILDLGGLYDPPRALMAATSADGPSAPTPTGDDEDNNDPDPGTTAQPGGSPTNVGPTPTADPTTTNVPAEPITQPTGDPPVENPNPTDDGPGDQPSPTNGGSDPSPTALPVDNGGDGDDGGEGSGDGDGSDPGDGNVGGGGNNGGDDDAGGDPGSGGSGGNGGNNGNGGEGTPATTQDPGGIIASLLNPGPTNEPSAGGSSQDADPAGSGPAGSDQGDSQQGGLQQGGSQQGGSQQGGSQQGGSQQGGSQQGGSQQGGSGSGVSDPQNGDSGSSPEDNAPANTDQNIGDLVASVIGIASPSAGSQSGSSQDTFPQQGGSGSGSGSGSDSTSESSDSGSDSDSLAPAAPLILTGASATYTASAVEGSQGVYVVDGSQTITATAAPGGGSDSSVAAVVDGETVVAAAPPPPAEATPLVFTGDGVTYTASAVAGSSGVYVVDGSQTVTATAVGGSGSGAGSSVAIEVDGKTLTAARPSQTGSSDGDDNDEDPSSSTPADFGFGPATTSSDSGPVQTGNAGSITGIDLFAGAVALLALGL